MELQDNVFYTPTQFAELRNCSVPTALNIYNSQDFPSELWKRESCIRKCNKRMVQKEKIKGG